METPLKMKLFLFFLFLVGMALNVLIILDATWLRIYLVPPGTGGQTTTAGTPPEVKPELDRIKESILLVLVPKCDGSGTSSGTGFVVKSGYVATAAHVIGDHYTCNSEIQLVDSFGVTHPAAAEGYSEADDLAILRISERSIAPLTLADSRSYQSISDVVEVVTIGYPLVGTASDVKSAAISGEGNISRFNAENNRFVTSGLNVNPGNSGGPVFLKDDWTVIGIASAKMDVTVGEGIGYIVPINLFKQFFFDTTDENL